MKTIFIKANEIPTKSMSKTRARGREVLPVVGDYITKGGRINLKILEMFLEYLGRVEDDMCPGARRGGNLCSEYAVEYRKRH